MAFVTCFTMLCPLGFPEGKVLDEKSGPGHIGAPECERECHFDDIAPKRPQEVPKRAPRGALE